MSVKIEFINVLVPVPRIEEAFPGGLARYERRAPDDSFERDGEPIILIGWDATSKTLKIFSFTQASRQAYVDEITVTGKGPTFRSERVYGPKDDD